jgi:hypothetical protein
MNGRRRNCVLLSHLAQPFFSLPPQGLVTISSEYFAGTHSASAFSARQRFETGRQPASKPEEIRALLFLAFCVRAIADSTIHRHCGSLSPSNVSGNAHCKLLSERISFHQFTLD